MRVRRRQLGAIERSSIFILLAFFYNSNVMTYLLLMFHTEAAKTKVAYAFSGRTECHDNFQRWNFGASENTEQYYEGS